MLSLTMSHFLSTDGQQPTCEMKSYLSILFRTGDLVEPGSGRVLMTFYKALTSGVYKTVYDMNNRTVLHPPTGLDRGINQAVKTLLLGHDTCLVYDTEQAKQVR